MHPYFSKGNKSGKRHNPAEKKYLPAIFPKIFLNSSTHASMHQKAWRTEGRMDERPEAICPSSLGHKNRWLCKKGWNVQGEPYYTLIVCAPNDDSVSSVSKQGTLWVAKEPKRLHADDDDWSTNANDWSEFRWAQRPSSRKCRAPARGWSGVAKVTCTLRPQASNWYWLTVGQGLLSL